MKQFMFKFILMLGLMVSFSFTTNEERLDPPTEDLETATVSYYGKKFHGRLTASGEPFDMHDMTCAHKSLKFGTKVEFTNPKQEE